MPPPDHEVILRGERVARRWREREGPLVTSGRIQAVVAVGSAVVWATDRWHLL